MFSTFHHFLLNHSQQPQFIRSILLSQQYKEKTQDCQTPPQEQTFIFQEVEENQNICQTMQKSEFQNTPSSNLNCQMEPKIKENMFSSVNQEMKQTGRGGNCIAANLSKTLMRIIDLNLCPSLKKSEFDRLVKKYEINTQKQSTFVLMLLLHVLARQQKLTKATYEKIMIAFLKSIKSSEQSSTRRISLQQHRKGFHTKNKRMLIKFTQIIVQIYQRSIANLEASHIFALSDLETIISDTYERKQRETQKAMSRITSIILDHAELRSLFGLDSVDVEKTFCEAIQFSYRRNMPKKCRQIVQRVMSVFGHFHSINSIHTQHDFFIMCFFVSIYFLQEKKKAIWDEFVLSLKRKNQFNMTTEELSSFQRLLKQEIPQGIKRVCEARKQWKMQQASRVHRNLRAFSNLQVAVKVEQDKPQQSFSANKSVSNESLLYNNLVRIYEASEYIKKLLELQCN